MLKTAVPDLERTEEMLFHREERLELVSTAGSRFCTNTVDTVVVCDTVFTEVEVDTAVVRTVLTIVVDVDVGVSA